MKIKKKYLLILVLLLIIISIMLLFVINNKKEITCISTNKNNNITYNIYLKNKISKINIEYNLNYETMDEVVDKYDNVNAYLNLIKKNNGVTTNIIQENKNLKYNISYDLNSINNKEYDLYGIKDIVSLKNKKDIIKYFEEMNYICD